jgi:hypothetical protein
MYKLGTWRLSRALALDGGERRPALPAELRALVPRLARERAAREFAASSQLH